MFQDPNHNNKALNNAYQHHFHHGQKKNSASGRTTLPFTPGSGLIPIPPPPWQVFRFTMTIIFLVDLHRGLNHFCSGV